MLTMINNKTGSVLSSGYPSRTLANNVTRSDADFHRYVDQACYEAANRITTVLFSQLLQNLANLTRNSLNTTAFANVTANSKDIEQYARLQTAILEVLSENVRKGFTSGEAFDNNSTLNHTASTQKHDNSNIFFLLTMGIFIYFMEYGFALMEIGMVRTKNVANSIWKNVFYGFASALGYWLFGMALSFGKSWNGVAGSTFWAFRDMPMAANGQNDLMLFFFEYTFCTGPGSIVTSAIAERAQISCFVVYSFLASALTYPIIVHSCWAPDGWLKQGSLYTFNGKEVRIGFQDFAGSGVVHSCGGVAGLIAAIFVGPRIGRFTPDGKVNEINGHSLTFLATGAMAIFTGAIAFNAGSQLTIENAEDALQVNRAAVNTIISATGGFLTVALVSRIVTKRWLVIPMVYGGLAGCVAICSSCNNVQTWAAYSIGTCAGLNFMLITRTLRRLKIDDSDVAAVHWGGGFVGCLATAFFKIDTGIFYRWDQQSAMMLAWQLLGFASISIWSASNTYVIFYVMKMFNMVRVDPETELLGLDYAHGHELAYPIEAYAKPNISCGFDEQSSNSYNYDQRVEKMYDRLFETEMSKFSRDYINKPGWSHPVLGGVLYDLSWISVVRSRRKEMEKRQGASFSSNHETRVHEVNLLRNKSETGNNNNLSEEWMKSQHNAIYHVSETALTESHHHRLPNSKVIKHRHNHRRVLQSQKVALPFEPF